MNNSQNDGRCFQAAAARLAACDCRPAQRRESPARRRTACKAEAAHMSLRHRFLALQQA
ncbi:MAG: hypothetical protein ACREBY_20590 [Polaromonas sp.]